MKLTKILSVILGALIIVPQIKPETTIAIAETKPAVAALNVVSDNPQNLTIENKETQNELQVDTNKGVTSRIKKFAKEHPWATKGIMAVTVTGALGGLDLVMKALLKFLLVNNS